ncbi:transglutaminase-like domain-containing protein [Litorihabitans aurantiacus]|uniref:Transglutaminase-like protein n=1 Tax=Litorihabitans aurantiacus TaxID=1930061 RepID=A0AA37UNL9_9MICO|nr:transglutaminase family protein [Litorihabitans aurantiacus]GMA30251.1 putative transglutaminase-like protein [Litorihabitans aurantiacus]
MRRSVSSTIELTLSEGPAQLAFMVAVARVPGLRIDERLTIHLGDEPVTATEIVAPHHGVVHDLTVDPGVSGTPLVLSYHATVEDVWDDLEASDDGEEADPIVGEAGGPIDLLMYLRPSRYAESDKFLGTSRAEFAGLRGRELLQAVSDWVNQHLRYTPGWSRPTDGAVETLLARQGVCRDFAHVAVALLRALDVPARLTAVYAPGLFPMDFHAVAEAWVEDGWHVVDPTRLAPRQTLVRVATGRDASDTAFLSSYGARLTLDRLKVLATSEPYLPTDDHTALLRIP